MINIIYNQFYLKGCFITPFSVNILKKINFLNCVFKSSTNMENKNFKTNLNDCSQLTTIATDKIQIPIYLDAQATTKPVIKK